MPAIQALRSARKDAIASKLRSYSFHAGTPPVAAAERSEAAATGLRGSGSAPMV
ncbi:hypothetical protein C4K10_1404 [Pseudomonas chlororaphis subsp. aureofaciens]|nr:hypothetical protein C4K10_1404 [Pseudomonas chlororaphis subsp. aureofaciens]